MPGLSASFQRVVKAEEQSDKAPLRIHYPTITVTNPGSFVPKGDAKTAPTFSISSSIANSKTGKYIIIALDPDAPAPSMPIAGPVLHEIQADLAPQGEADADGFIKLVANAAPAASYGAPNPPPISSAHRYPFTIWEQPADITTDQIKSRLGLPDEVGIWPRARWDQDGCEKKLGLGEALGGNYFLSK